MSTVFFSYSHADEVLRDLVEKALTMLRREGVIESFHDRRIPPGDVVDDSINAELERADLILLLVSPDFLASTYCYEREMARALERHARGEAMVIPIILRPCEWQKSSIGRIMALPTDGKPVTKFTDIDDAMLVISTGIRQALDARGTPKTVPARLVPPSGPKPPSGPRSSKLQIKKTFSDIDRDRFKDGAFEFIARFFENSLEELEARNPEIQGSFKRVDASQFTANVYRNGSKVAFCRVFLDHGSSSGIAYSSIEHSPRSFNESLSVEVHDDGLRLKALGMASYGGDDRHLTEEGGAELYWDLLIKDLR